MASTVTYPAHFNATLCNIRNWRHERDAPRAITELLQPVVAWHRDDPEWLSDDRRGRLSMALHSAVRCFQLLDLRHPASRALAPTPLEELIQTLEALGYLVLGSDYRDLGPGTVEALIDHIRHAGASWSIEGAESRAFYRACNASELVATIEQARRNNGGSATLLGTCALAYYAEDDAEGWLHFDRAAGLRIVLGPESRIAPSTTKRHQLVAADVQVGAQVVSDDDIAVPERIEQFAGETYNCLHLTLATRTGRIGEMSVPTQR